MRVTAYRYASIDDARAAWGRIEKVLDSRRPVTASVGVGEDQNGEPILIIGATVDDVLDDLPWGDGREIDVEDNIVEAWEKRIAGVRERDIVGITRQSFPRALEATLVDSGDIEIKNRGQG